MKPLSAILLSALLLSPVQPAFADNFSISLDGVYDRRLSGNAGHNNASGGSLQLQYHPIDHLSLGLDLTGLVFWGTETPIPVLAESVNFTGRFILNPGDGFTGYLAAQAGFNPKLDISSDLLLWQGSMHAMAGVGGWFFLNPLTAVNLMAGYDFFSPLDDPLQNLQGRLGLTFFFQPMTRPAGETPAPQPQPASAPEPPAAPALGTNEGPGTIPEPEAETATSHDLEAASAPEPTPETKPEPDLDPLTPPELESEPEPTPEPAKQEAAAEPVPGPSSDELETEPTPEPAPVAEPVKEPAVQVQPGASPAATLTKTKSVKGDSLWDTAARPEVYGDPELYPLLVDANRKKLKAGTFVLSPGTALTIPRNVSPKKEAAARKNAWKASYTKLRGRGLTPTAYQRWRYNHGLSSTWVEPADESQRGNLPRQ